MLAADDAGSTDAILERILVMDTRDSVRNGHRGGDSGDAGLDRSLLGRGVSASGAGVVTELDNGLFLSEFFLSLPFPRTVFLSDPFLLRF